MNDKQPEALKLADILQHKIPSILALETAAAELRRLHTVNQALVEALQKLACLGNGDRYGNSDGNCIAQAALAKVQGDKDGTR